MEQREGETREPDHGSLRDADDRASVFATGIEPSADMGSRRWTMYRDGGVMGPVAAVTNRRAHEQGVRTDIRRHPATRPCVECTAGWEGRMAQFQLKPWSCMKMFFGWLHQSILKSSEP